MADKVHLCSLNCQGLGSKEKRERLNIWKKNQKSNILYIQESHFIQEIENTLYHENDDKKYHSYGNKQSRGVSIFINANLNYKLIKEIKDNEGRFLLINIEIDNNNFTLVNIYAPNKQKERNSYYKKIDKLIKENRMGILILGGDMNESLSKIDRKGNFSDKIVSSFKKLKKTHKLIDIWREINPKLEQFTWRRKHNHNIASRIDYFLISPDIRPHVVSADIRPAMISCTDHQAISLMIRLPHINKGRGYFKINNSILDNDTYKDIIKNLINSYQKKMGSQDPRVLWDLFKLEVKELTSSFCKRLASEKKNIKRDLEIKLKNLNKQDSKNPNVIHNIKEIENELEQLYIKDAKGAQVRSRIKWIEEGEKNTKFFASLEKSRQAKKTITALKDENGNITSNQTNILNVEKKYYENLYCSTDPDEAAINNYINDTKINHKLKDSESKHLEGELSIEECTQAVFNMKINKSPGLDGLTVEFYRTFWEELKNFMVIVFNYCFNHQELTSSQKIGVLSLLYKKNDPLNLDNYRPITLLNVDVKIIAYALAQRLKPILPKIIHNDQNGYVKNRYIGFNIRQIQDIIEYSEKYSVEGAILFIDFSKAFDSLEWSFMYKSLVKFGLPESFINWVKTLYNDIKGCIINNGWISAPYCIHRGIRQGCPLSSIIFVIAAEVLACKIRQDTNIKGFEIKIDEKTHTIKISQLADDTTLFLKSKKDVTLSINVLEEFGTLSGLKINKSKTEGIWVGSRQKHCKEKFEDINWNNGPVKSLGVYFGLDQNECDKLNFEKITDKIKNEIKKWEKRKLTMIGRITVAKTFLISNITFLASVTRIPIEIFNQLKTIIYNYVWENKSEKISRKILSKNYVESGLKMTNLDNFLNAIKLSWIQRIQTADKANWKLIPLFFFNNYGENSLLFKMQLDKLKSIPNLNKNMPKFYFELIDTFIKTNNPPNTLPKEFRTIRQQLVWGNQFIKTNNKCLIFQNWIKNGILFINDIINEKGEISEKIVLEKLKVKTNWISEFIQLKKAIPQEWKEILKQEISTKTKVKTKLNQTLTIKNEKITFENAKVKTIYNLINREETDTLSPGLSKWKRLFNLENRSIFNASLEFTFLFFKHNKLKVFRWKLLHHILPNRKLLFTWKLASNENCLHCQIPEDYEHFFINCKYLDDFWKKIQLLFSKLKLDTHVFSYKSLILGYKIEMKEYYPINLLLNIILFSIHKNYYLSDYKQKQINMFDNFKRECKYFLLSYSDVPFCKKCLEVIESVV